jgi:hypothetical protein
VLYDYACDVLEAAFEMRDAGETQGSSTAIAPTLGCLEASLEALAEAVDAIRVDAQEGLAHGALVGGRQGTALAVWRGQRLEALSEALRFAHRASAEARAAVGPLAAQLARDEQ